MFSKKGKSEGSIEKNVPNRSSAGQSLFAPGLNPLPSQFNLNYSAHLVSQPLPPAQSWNEPPVIEPQVPPPPLHWDPTPEIPEVPQSSTSLMEEASSLTAPSMSFAEVVAPLWEPPEPPAQPVETAYTWESPTQTEEPLPPTQVYEPAAEGFSMDVEQSITEVAPMLDAFPPLPPEMYMPESTMDTANVDWQMYSSTSPVEGIDINSNNEAWEVPTPTPDWAQSSSHSESQDLWESFNTPQSALETPMDPAAFLDTVNQHLYPEDPFSDPMSAIEGAQAFEEAAQFLFPETVSASLEWNEDNAGKEPNIYLSSESTLEGPVDLGPSFQPEATSLNDLSTTASWQESGESATFLSPELANTSSEEPSSIATEGPASELSWDDLGMPAPLPKEHFYSEPGAEGTQWENSPTLEAASAEALFWTTEETDDPAVLWAPPEPAFPAEGYVPPESPESISTDYTPHSSWFNGEALPQQQEEPLTASIEETFQAAESALENSENSLDAFLSDDDDFYASSFTLTADGDIVPAYGEAAPPAASKGILPTASAPEMTESPIEPPPTLEFLPSEPDLLAENDPRSVDQPIMPSSEPLYSEEVTSWSQENWPAGSEEATAALPTAEPLWEPEVVAYNWDNAPIQTIQTNSASWNPSPTPEAFVPIPAAEKPPTPITANPETLSAEELWEQPELGEVAHIAATSQPELSFDSLEILGVCQLTEDKRLLLVQSQHHFALMGQAGLENPDVTVIKIFDHNPIAYQNTFTAMQEGQAGDHGMFVAQVGTWHAILSAFQNQIVLHTELG